VGYCHFSKKVMKSQDQMMTQEDRKNRLMRIARRWTAYRAGRFHAAHRPTVNEDAGVPEDLLAELPDCLLS
jgi:hypothetical protein